MISFFKSRLLEAILIKFVKVCWDKTQLALYVPPGLIAVQCSH